MDPINPGVGKTELPPMPPHCATLRVQAPKVGEPLILIAARYKGGVQTLNQRIAACVAWYAGVRESYAAPVQP